jgi:hypothetical protein
MLARPVSITHGPGVCFALMLYLPALKAIPSTAPVNPQAQATKPIAITSINTMQMIRMYLAGSGSTTRHVAGR